MKALLIIFVILSVIALIPVGVDGGYNSEGLRLYIRIGFFQLRVAPPGRLVQQITEKAKKPKKKKQISAETAEKAKKPKPKPDKDKLLSLLKMALRALARFRRKLTVDYLRIHICFAADDPFKTAMSYGTANAALCAITPLAEKAFNITERDYGVSADFLGDGTQLDFWLTASIQIWEIIYVAAAFGIDLLKSKRKNKEAAAAADEHPTN